MYKGWAPNVLDALFCDRKDHYGLYWHFDLIEEEAKYRSLKQNETMTVTYKHLPR